MPKCRSCGATIQFHFTHTGKQMRCNPGVVEVLGRDGFIYKGLRPHRCQDADRKKEQKK